MLHYQEAGPGQSPCWLWLLYPPGSAAEILKTLCSDDMVPAQRVDVGGETDDWTNDMGLGFFANVQIHLTDKQPYVPFVPSNKARQLEFYKPTPTPTVYPLGRYLSFYGPPDPTTGASGVMVGVGSDHQVPGYGPDACDGLPTPSSTPTRTATPTRTPTPTPSATPTPTICQQYPSQCVACLLNPLFCCVECHRGNQLMCDLYQFLFGVPCP